MLAADTTHQIRVQMVCTVEKPTPELETVKYNVHEHPYELLMALGAALADQEIAVVASPADRKRKIADAVTALIPIKLQAAFAAICPFDSIPSGRIWKDWPAGCYHPVRAVKSGAETGEGLTLEICVGAMAGPPKVWWQIIVLAEPVVPEQASEAQ